MEIQSATASDKGCFLSQRSENMNSSSCSDHDDNDNYRGGAMQQDSQQSCSANDGPSSSSSAVSSSSHACHHRPNLFDAAKLGLELSVQKWADINASDCNLRSIEHIAQRIFALLLIRILALRSKKGAGRGGSTSTNRNKMPVFPDLSTTSICHAILSQGRRLNDAADEMHKAKEGDEEKQGQENVQLDWPDVMTDELFSQLYQYVYQILQSYRPVSYHNHEHAYHVFISAHKLLDMVLCESDYSHGGSSPVKKQTRVTYGLKSDPLVHLAYLFSALVHDVDHTGVSNRQLVMESDELAIMYNDQSVAEQRSLAIAFSLLMTKDFQTLRHVIFETDGDYMKFRKIVIDLVLCTDIASPERVQIVKSKWKEAFGDKSHASLSPVHIHSHSSCFEGVPSFTQRMNGHRMEDDSDSAGQTTLPMVSPRTRVSSAESNHEQPVDASEMAGPPMENSLTLSQRKKRNAWKSEPADDSLRNPGKLKLVYYFFAHRGSMMTGKRLPSRNSCNSENTILKKKKKNFLTKSLKFRARKQKGVREDVGPDMDTVERDDNGLESELSTKRSAERIRKDKVQKDTERTNDDTKEEIEKIQDILNEYEEDLSVSSEFSESSSAYPRVNIEETKRRRSEDVSKILSSCKQEFENITLDDQPLRNNSMATSSTMVFTTKYPSQKRVKTSRRFTEPPNPFVDRKKFHLRLGICRALDLPGNQINDYKIKSATRVENDPDHPNEFKMIVVLEQMMKAADVAANMQSWDTMICWSKRLFKELKASYEDGRGNDPVADWHENQIAFFESYTMPLACRLVETGIFEFHEVQELVNGVRQNNIRWMIEGRLVLERMIREWDMLQKTNNSRKRAVSNVGF